MDLTSSANPFQMFQVEFLHWMCFGKREVVWPVGLERLARVYFVIQFLFLFLNSCIDKIKWTLNVI